jgi:hypothetical protein
LSYFVYKSVLTCRIIQYCIIENCLSDVLCEKYRKYYKQENAVMAKAQRYSMEQIRAVQKRLRALPPKMVGKTRAEAVELLAGDIRKAVGKGHSPAEIRDILAREGIQAPLSRLAALLQKEERTEGKKEEDAAPVQYETAGRGLFIMPEKTEGS